MKYLRLLSKIVGFIAIVLAIANYPKASVVLFGTFIYGCMAIAPYIELDEIGE